MSDQTSSAPGIDDIVIRVTPEAAATMPDDVLASLKDAATRLEKIIQATPSFKCQKVEKSECAVFVECTGVTI